MYNQIGLNVLRYECSILEEANERDRVFAEGAGITDIKDIYQSSINERTNKLNRYRAKLKDLSDDHDPRNSLKSYESLEFLYQDFLSDYLPLILKSIEKFYFEYIDSLLEHSVVLFMPIAKKVAAYSLMHHAASSIVDDILLRQKSKEITNLDIPLSSENITVFLNTCEEKSNILAIVNMHNYIQDEYRMRIHAIEQKYDYFTDRLAHCLEIGNKIRELQRSK